MKLMLIICVFLVASQTSINWAQDKVANEKHDKLFDMPAIRDASTLEIEIIQDWHRVEGSIPTRQKLVTIEVGEFWPGQDYRVPVRLVVPVDQKAKGFHLTGGNNPKRLKQDIRPNSLELEFIKGGVGLVYTIVQDLKQLGYHSG